MLDPAVRERMSRRLPKVALHLHLHIEGALEPETMFGPASKHGVTLTNGVLVQPAENAVRTSFLPATARTALLGKLRTEAARA